MFEQFKRTHAEQYRDVFTRIRNAAEAGWDEVVVPYKLHSELYDALGDAGYKLFYGNIKEDGEFRATLNERGKSSVCKSGAPSKIVAVFAALFHNPERDNVKIGRELGVSREYVSQIRMAMREHGITKILNADSQTESKKV